MKLALFSHIIGILPTGSSTYNKILSFQTFSSPPVDQRTGLQEPYEPNRMSVTRVIITQ